MTCTICDLQVAQHVPEVLGPPLEIKVVVAPTVSALVVAYQCMYVPRLVGWGAGDV